MWSSRDSSIAALKHTNFIEALPDAVHCSITQGDGHACLHESTSIIRARGAPCCRSIGVVALGTLHDRWKRRCLYAPRSVQRCRASPP